MFVFRKNGHYYERVGKKGEPVCINEEIPFDIPDSWEFCALDNIIYNTPTKKHQIKRSEIKEQGLIPVISQSQIFVEGYSNKNNKIINVDVPTIIFGDHTKNIKYIDFNFIVGADGVKILNPILIYPKFLFYLISFIKINMNDRGYSRHYQFLKEKYYPLPPLEEQKRIVNKIEDILPLIEEYGVNEEKLDKLNSEFPDKLKSSILQEAIQGKLVPQDSNDEPASVLLEKIKEEKERLIKEKKIKRNKNDSFIYKCNNHFYEKIGDNEPVCIDDEIPFEVPDSWEWVRLDGVCKYIQRGKSPKYSEIKKYPVVAQKCNQWSGFSLEKAKFIDPKTVDSYNEERILQNKDIMWNSTGLGTLGRVGLYDESVNKYGWAVADSHVTIIRPFAEYILQEFIYLFLASPTVQLVIESKAGGSTKQKELNLSTVKNYLIPLSPYNEQKRIIKKVYDLNKIIG